MRDTFCKGVERKVYRKCGKRCIDFLLALFALSILFLPLLVLTVLTAIKMRGNPFFVQPRPGYREKIFHLIKFRSMRNTTDAEGNLLPDEQRLTSYGRFLRSTSLDELPELINVLKGDMSLIGPRPEVPFHVRHFKEEVPLYLLRQQVRPGITGWAQVNGLRGDTSIEARVSYDLWYIENWNIWLDMKILLMTVAGGMINEECVKKENS